MEHTLTTVFFILLIFKFLFENYLNTRNEKYVIAKMDKVPNEFIDKITLEEHQKAALYTKRKSKFGRLTNFFSLITLLIWLPLGALNALDNFVRSFSENEIYRGLILFGIFTIINLLIDLPSKIYSTFVIEEEFGFNKTTPKMFTVDTIKQLLIGVAIGGPFLYGLLLILDKLGAYWWFFAWTFLISFQFIMILLYPTFIAPIFNKFSKLEDDGLKKVIENLLTRVGFAHSGIFIMDASKRSSHGNAYFTGFGKTKRIVFFDNLINFLSPNQIEAVLAHELGHFKHKHIVKMLLVSTIGALISFYILGKCYQSQVFFNAHFIDQRSTYMALLLFSLVMPLYTFFITPVFSIFSRKHEYEADTFAATHSSAKELINALVSLYKENASSLTPDPFYSKFYFSHPPALERINFLKSIDKN